MATSTDDLIILTQAEFARLKQDLKEAELDLCYVAQGGQPLRLDWSGTLFTDPKFIEQLETHRPADLSYRIVSVRQTKKGGWFRPDEFGISFHAVGAMQDTKLQQYLTDHNLTSSTETPKAMLGDL